MIICDFFSKILNFFFYLEHCYYRGYYIAHRDVFRDVILDIEGIDIDDIFSKF